MGIKNIIFDVYGTLISTGTGSVDATKKIFDRYKLEVEAKELYNKWKIIHKKNKDGLVEFISEKEIFSRDLEELFGIYGIDDEPCSCVQPMIESLYGRVLFDDVEHTLNILLNKFDVAIGSTTDNAPFYENVNGTVLSKIKNVYTSEDLKCYKPKTVFYEEILKKSNWDAKDCLFVGDSLEDDVLGPMSVGMKAVLINRTGKDIEGIQNIKTIHSLSELLEMDFAELG